MSALSKRQIDYVVWQNRATRFYLASRLCYIRQLHAPAAYCGVIALELVLKATLVYHDKSFTSTHFRHSIAKLTRALRNKVPLGRTVELPAYFWHEDRYLTVTRYPTKGRGVVVPATFLTDLDAAFAALLKLTPFQHNTELKRILTRRRGTERTAITRSNAQIRSLRKFLNAREKRASHTTGA